MHKLRTTVAALVVSIIAIPTAAFSATNTYRSTLVKDPLNDVIVYPSGRRIATDPAIDLYKLIGYRYANNFQVTVTYKHLTRAPYTHRMVEFFDRTSGDVTRSTLIDMGIGADGGKTTTTVIVDKYNNDTGDASNYVLPCAGAKASPNYDTSKVVFTLPVTCFKNYDQSAARLFIFSGRWRSNEWPRVIPTVYMSSDPYPVHSDFNNATDIWTWDRSVPSGRNDSRPDPASPTG